MKIDKKSKVDKPQRSKHGGLDKYYTKPYLANYLSALCLDRYGPDNTYIEPCAGNGAFLSIIEGIKGYDLEPEGHKGDIEQRDALKGDYEEGSIIISNPPYGFAGSLALSIFNHIASYDVKAICFILPRSFQKRGMQRKMDKRYHLKLEIELPMHSFLLKGTSYDVPSCFQVWELCKKGKERDVSKVKIPPYLSFCSREEGQVAVRRVGGRAGQVIEYSPALSSSSTYFLRNVSSTLLKALKLMNYKDYVNKTAGVRSISKEEIALEVVRIMEVLNE